MWKNVRGSLRSGKSHNDNDISVCSTAGTAQQVLQRKAQNREQHSYLLYCGQPEQCYPVCLAHLVRTYTFCLLLQDGHSIKSGHTYNVSGLFGNIFG